MIDARANGLYKTYNEEDKRFHAGIDIMEADHVTLRDNVVAGSERSAFKTKGDFCETHPEFRAVDLISANNVGRSVLHGLIINKYVY